MSFECGVDWGVLKFFDELEVNVGDGVVKVDEFTALNAEALEGRHGDRFR